MILERFSSKNKEQSRDGFGCPLIDINKFLFRLMLIDSAHFDSDPLSDLTAYIFVVGGGGGLLPKIFDRVVRPASQNP